MRRYAGLNLRFDGVDELHGLLPHLGPVDIASVLVYQDGADCEHHRGEECREESLYLNSRKEFHKYPENDAVGDKEGEDLGRDVIRNLKKERGVPYFGVHNGEAENKRERRDRTVHLEPWDE